MAANPEVVVEDFLSNCPLPLVNVLVQLGPYITLARHCAEIFNWRGYDSWLALAFWWAICVLAEISIRYLLPIVVVLLFAVRKWTALPRTTPAVLTEANVRTTISDLLTIQVLLPSPMSLPNLPLNVVMRVAFSLYLPFLLFAFYVPTRLIVALSGSFILVFRSPWFTAIRHVVWKSAWIRWSVYFTWAKLSGIPIPPASPSIQSSSDQSPKPLRHIKFLFQIYENQRWWMGLDWTAALLPSDHPSWCSENSHAVNPPNAFSLPDPSSIYVSGPGSSRIKRTATWSWEEPEWKVLTCNDDGILQRLNRPLPSLNQEKDKESLLAKAAGRMRESQPPSDDSKNETSSLDEDHDEESNENVTTDSDGWVYGDNKWEAKSSKGGMGKYTRYRRWTRVALLSETETIVEAGELGVEHVKTEIAQPVTTSSPLSSPINGESPSSPLRQRLRYALNRASISS